VSILQQVIDEYGISEMPEALTDKTDKRASVSSVSEWSELLKNGNGEFEPEEMPVVSKMVEIAEMRAKGQTPAHYTSTTTCKHCGPVPIWEGCPPEVLGCPWCFNRHQNLPLPQKGNQE
jgi:hypothetical protein